MALTAQSPRAHALDIQLFFDAASSDLYLDPDDSSNRTFELIPIMNAAAAYYEDLIEDNHTLSINYYWDNLSDPNGTIGLHSNTATVAGRETSCVITFDTTLSGNYRRYYIDPTPNDDGEFDMQSTVYSNLSATDQANWYNGSPNASLEAGYRGTAFPGAPSDAQNGIDLYTVALHEIGHALGLTGSVASPETSTDFDYDVDSTLVDGAVFAAECRSSTNQYHLDGGLTLMFPSVSSGLRTLPSATDILAMSSASNWGDLDLDRKYFNGSGDWNTNGNWIGGDRPDSTEDALVVDLNASVTLSAVGSARSLRVANGADLFTGGNPLTVGGAVTVADANSQIFVQTGGTLTATSVTLSGGGELDLDGGLANINGSITISDAASDITGNGTVDVQTSLNNNGVIRPDGTAVVLTITSAAGSINLDGTSETGSVDALFGSVTFDAPLTDGFSSTMTVGIGRTVTFNNGWTLTSAGQLNLIGSATQFATVGGGTSTISGDIDVTSQARIDGFAVFNSTANVSVPSGAILELEDGASFNGGTYTGAGEIQQDGPVSVNSATTIAVATYDMDGFSGTETITLQPSSGLTLNVTNLDDGNNIFNGTINSNLFGTLTVNTPAAWTMSGTLNVEGDPANALMYTVLSGSPVTLNGSTIVDGPASFSADLTITGAVTTIDAQTTVRLAGSQAHRIQGGSISGPGMLGMVGPASLSGFGTIGAVINTSTGSQLLAEDGVLTINGAIQAAGVIGTADASGTLSVTPAWNTANTDELLLQGGSVQGGTITNGGITRGQGTIAAADFVNNGTLSADFGGTLVLNTGSFPDLDGTGAEDGVINATAGNIRVQGNFGSLYTYNATLNVQNFEFRMDQQGLSVQTGGAINLNGGRYVAPLFTLDNGGVLTTTTAAAELQSATIQFRSGSISTLNAPLELAGNTTIFSGATINGPSFLDVQPGFTLVGNATLGAGLVNQGTVNAGLSPGVLSVTSFTQTAGGSLKAEITGTLAGSQYDVLQVSGLATLAGSLDVDLSGYVPVPGDVFQVLRYGSRAGQFSSIIDQNFGGGAGQFFWPVYLGDHLSLYVPLVGDANFDGTVSGADYTIWADNFGTGSSWGRGDFNGDGQVTGADYTLWADGFGQSVALSAMNPVPEASSLLLAAVAMAAALGWKATQRRRLNP